MIKEANREMIKLVIFDFDGTVADSKSVYYSSINKHLNPLGFSRKRIDEAIDLGMNLGETLKKFVPGAIYRWWIRRKIMKDVLIETNEVRKCHDISHIKDIHIKKILVSNSLREFVCPVLKHLKARQYFNRVYCADDFNDKKKFILTYLKIHGIRPNEAFYIGDRVADVKLAKKLGLHNIIISGKCAWDSKKELLKAKPEFIVPDLIFVKRIVEKFRG